MPTAAAPTRSGLPDPTPPTELVSRRRHVSAGALIGIFLGVILAGGGAGVAAGLLVDGQRTTTTTPTAVPPTTAPPTSAVLGDPSPPAGARLIHDDPLAEPGLWELVDDPNRQTTCAFDGRLVATSERVSYRCRGPEDALTDTAVFVDVTLLNPGSCAAVWFRFTDGTGGYAVRICGDGYHLVSHDWKSSSVKQLHRMVPEQPIAVGEPMRVGVVIEGDDMTFFHNGERVGEWHSAAYSEGRVVLGLLQSEGADAAPYRAAFANVVVWGVGV
jgi:hypothetical protein